MRNSQQKVKPLKLASGAFRMRHRNPHPGPDDTYQNLTARVKGKMHNLADLLIDAKVKLREMLAGIPKKGRTNKLKAPGGSHAGAIY